MAFNQNDVSEDDNFSFDADPAIRKAMKREAGAAVMQDIGLNVYYAGTVGSTKYPGIHQLYLRELGQNLAELMRTRMSYIQLEEYLSVLGYGVEDIRSTFREQTGLDPVLLENQRHADVLNTPCNIPCFNMGWGYAKKGGGSLFIMPGRAGLLSAFHQVDDMTREEVGTFLTLDEARAYIKSNAKRLHVYDKSAIEQVEEAMTPIKDESTKKEYRALANHFYTLRQQGNLDAGAAERMVADAVYSGQLTEEEGRALIELHAAPMPPSEGGPTQDKLIDNPKATPDMEYQQSTRDVMDEVERVTPQDFFQSVLPDRIDQIAPEHIKNVLTYVSHRQKDMSEFDIKLHSLEYMKHETPQVLVETNPSNGRPSGPPRATISVILEIKDKTLPAEKSRKFGLLVFFISPDGEVGTSDSIKGEDDIIYGFTDDGLRQYFSKERMLSGMGGGR